MIDGKEYQVNSDGSASPDDLLARYASAFVVLVTLLVCLPFLWGVSLVGDEGISLHAAQRLLDGQVLYRDFFEFHPPVGFLAIYGWLSIFGSTLVAARLYIVAVILLISWLTFSCSRHLSGRSGISAFLTLAWVVASQGYWTQVNHHWLTSLLSMLSLWALLVGNGKRQRPAIAGFAASAATLVTTHRGGLVAIAGLLALLSHRSEKQLPKYIAAGLALLAVILAFLWWQGTVKQAFEQVILYPIRHYSNIQSVPYGAFRDGQNVLLVLVFPITAILLALRVRINGYDFLARDSWRECLLFAIAGFVGIFPRPDAVHISFCVMLALPLLAGLMAHFLPLGQTRPVVRFAAAVLLLLFPLVSLTKAAMTAAEADKAHTDAGDFLLPRHDGSKQLISRLEAMRVDETVFVYPFSPILPFLTKQRHPARLDVFMPQYTTPDQYFATCLEVMENADWVVFDTMASKPANILKAFPAMDDPSPPEKTAFEAAIKHGFRRNQTFGRYELLRRVDAAPDCAKILP